LLLYFRAFYSEIFPSHSTITRPRCAHKQSKM